MYNEKQIQITKKTEKWRIALTKETICSWWLWHWCGVVSYCVTNTPNATAVLSLVLYGGRGMRSTQIIVTPIMHDILNLYISDYKMSLSTFLNTLTYCHKEMEETGRQPEKDKAVRNLLYLAILQYSWALLHHYYSIWHFASNIEVKRGYGDEWS